MKDYAGFGQRLMAMLIDLPLIFLPLFLLSGLTAEGWLRLILGTPPHDFSALQGFGMLVGAIWNLFYSVIFLGSRWQATPGMRVMGIFVIKFRKPRVRYRDATERMLVYSLLPESIMMLSAHAFALSAQAQNSLSLFLALLWTLPIAFSPEKTGLHDILCETRVLVGRPPLQAEKGLTGGD